MNVKSNLRIAFRVARLEYGQVQSVSLMEALMTKNKNRSYAIPAIAFIYLALVGGMVILSASRALAI
jgi:hypothetical protein